MKKRAFIIHGWGGYPREGWQDWLATELEKRGWQVFCPVMPDTDNPRIETWVPALAEAVGEADENTFFVSHSIGCQTTLRYIEGLEEGKKVGGAVFVAGFLNLKNLETEEEKRVSRPWLERPIDFLKIKKHTNKFVAIFSDDDYYVPLSDKDLFKSRLSAKIIIEGEKKHFCGEDGIVELPSVLASILEISK